MNRRVRKVLRKVHFTALVIAIGNFLTESLFSYSLEENIEFVIEVSIILSGLALFFLNLKPFRKINIYFSIYGVTLFLIVIGLLFRGILIVLIVSVILFPIIPENKKFEKDDIILSTPFQGLLSRCCLYKVKERQLFIFEKSYETFTEEGSINFDTMDIKHLDGEIILTYSTRFDDGIVTEKRMKK